MSIGVYIPARTKSNRLPNKLLLPFGKSNLFDLACEKISKLPEKYGRYALICEQELIDIANKHNLSILLRDEKTIHMDDPIRITMGAVEQAKEDYLMFLNPCLAFFSLDMIVDCLEEFEQLLDEGIEYATSCKPFKNWLFDYNTRQSLSPIDYKSLNTKNITGLVQAAHCFHIFNKEEFLKTGQMLQPNHGLIQVPDIATIDVDTKEDYLYAKWRWENLRS